MEELPSAEPVAPRARPLRTPAIERAIELAGELLRQRGLTDEQIDNELDKPPGSGFPEF
jgi:hypothetical protein